LPKQTLSSAGGLKEMALRGTFTAVNKPDPTWVEENFEEVQGSVVFDLPQLGHDLIIFHPGIGELPYNLGRIEMTEFAEKNGRCFNVRTNKSAKTFFVRLAPGITYPPSFFLELTASEKD
jgi:hypothetical protein